MPGKTAYPGAREASKQGQFSITGEKADPHDPSGIIKHRFPDGTQANQRQFPITGEEADPHDPSGIIKHRFPDGTQANQRQFPTTGEEADPHDPSGIIKHRFPDGMSAKQGQSSTPPVTPLPTAPAVTSFMGTITHIDHRQNLLVLQSRDGLARVVHALPTEMLACHAVLTRAAASPGYQSHVVVGGDGGIHAGITRSQHPPTMPSQHSPARAMQHQFHQGHGYAR